ncbi:MAG: hypothetical protein ACM3Z4_21070 [Hyphomicrobiales bacterium]
MNYPIDSRRVAFPATTTAAMCVALVGAALLWSQTAFAAPMRCSGEQKTCIAKCQEPRSGLDIDLRDQLRRASIVVHENRLLG